MGVVKIIRVIYGLFRDNGKENGKYFVIIWDILGLDGWLSKLWSLFGYPKY